MFGRTLIAGLVVAGLSLSVWAVEQEMAQEKRQMMKEQAKSQADEQIYGAQLMTTEERREYMRKMRAAKTQEEREQIRRENHQKMQERAKEKGVALPEEPPMGMGRGGMGPGGGGMMGPGGRKY